LGCHGPMRSDDGRGKSTAFYYFSISNFKVLDNQCRI
jgi:hypothetical protein